MDRREAAALDRHITGNYGEDQFRDEDGECPHCEQAWSDHAVITVFDSVRPKAYVCEDGTVMEVQDEVEPLCEDCGHPYTDHTPVHRQDALGNDYETTECPPMTQPDEPQLMNVELREGETIEEALTRIQDEIPEGMAIAGLIAAVPEGTALAGMMTAMEDHHSQERISAFIHAKLAVCTVNVADTGNVTEEEGEQIEMALNGLIDGLFTFTDAVQAIMDDRVLELLMSSVQTTMSTMQEYEVEVDPLLLEAYQVVLDSCGLWQAWRDSIIPKLERMNDLNNYRNNRTVQEQPDGD